MEHECPDCHQLCACRAGRVERGDCMHECTLLDTGHGDTVEAADEVTDGKTAHAEESAERTLIREFMEVMQAATDGLTDLVKRHHRAFPLWATKAAASAEGMSEMASTLREVLEVTDGKG